MKRRAALVSIALAPVVWGARGAHADEADFDKAMRSFLAGAKPIESRVTLRIEPLVDNGNSVPVTVAVDHPMAADLHIREIALFNEKNPQPDIAVFQLTPMNGRAEVVTRIRLAGTQRVAAIARASDGQCYLRTLDVIVTTAACVEMD
ncbi:MAG: thiosulfate oxidation carrier protein SoxY [Betaproteobacteria bacterium]|nr:thiosulfate oxidation carrier protein SoxY [Betaproteobacteria bacterium]